MQKKEYTNKTIKNHIHVVLKRESNLSDLMKIFLSDATHFIHCYLTNYPQWEQKQNNKNFSILFIFCTSKYHI